MGGPKKYETRTDGVRQHALKQSAAEKRQPKVDELRDDILAALRRISQAITRNSQGSLSKSDIETIKALDKTGKWAKKTTGISTLETELKRLREIEDGLNRVSVFMAEHKKKP